MLQTYGMSKSEILQALYNYARPMGMGFLHYQLGNLDPKEAEGMAEKHDYFDYFKGRVMKISITKLDPYLYDRDNGPGAAQQALDNFYTQLR